MVPKLKITAIKPYPVWVGTRNQLIVKVETDQGVYGWGESGLSSREKAVVGAIEHYREFLIGRDAMQIGRIWQEMYRSQYFEGGRVLQAAISAIDIALHDIKGKALGVPVYELLGGKQRDLVPTFATTRSEASSAEVLEQALELKAQGWQAIRLIPAGQRSDNIFEPRESIAETAKWTVRCREALGDQAVLGIDFHHRLSAAEAASFCQKMPRGTLDFLEEPIRDETPGAYEALRRLTDVPFAIGEEFSSKWQFLPYIERDIAQFNRIDICNVGGLTEAMKVTGWTEAHYIDMMPHNPLGPITTAASIHYGIATPNFSFLEYQHHIADAYPADLFPVMHHLDGPNFPLPTAPGLGVEFNEDAVKDYAFEYWEAPHWQRRDGSYTNW
jgi:galactonate dehydratase